MADNNGCNTDRRRFLQISAGLMAAAPFAGAITQVLTSETAHAADAKIEAVKPTDPQAIALGYIEDAKKVDVKKFPKRAGSEGAKMFCWNCQFYQAKDKSNPRGEASAPCTLFGTKHVKGAGWCNSWVENAIVTKPKK